MFENLPPAIIDEFLIRQYGIDGKLKRLASEIDLIYRVQDRQAKKYVVKIAPSRLPLDVLDMQHRCMDFLNAAGLGIDYPHVLRSRSGADIVELSDSAGVIWHARVLSYIEGTFFVDLKSHTPLLLRKIGSTLGSMDKALTGFSHPAASRAWVWDLKRAYNLADSTRAISDHARRRLADYFFLRFRNEVLPILPLLRSSVIHNDANDHNVLLTAHDREDPRIGYIDFGDMLHSQTIHELAIALAYFMLNKNDPWTAAHDLISGYNETFPLTDREKTVLFDLVAARLAVSVTLSAKRRATSPENDYLFVSEAPAWELLDKLIDLNAEQALTLVHQACGTHNPSQVAVDVETRLAERAQWIPESLSISYKQPLNIVRGAFQYLYSREGRRYLDCVNNVCHVGHCHPVVVGALQAQISRLNTNTRYLYDQLPAYAQRLAATMPDPLSVCFFVNSGSEANELALRLARTYLNSNHTIVVDHAYHGHTTSLIDISPYKFNGPGGKGCPSSTSVLPIADPYRGEYRSTDADAGRRYGDRITAILDGLQHRGISRAAFISESISGCGGQVVFPDRFFETVYKHVRARGGLCIADEVQVGFGRVGSHWWAFETQSVVPDIVTLGKPIGNGHPLAAVITTREIADAFDNGMEYFNTFGGNPVSCAAGMAVLDVIESEELRENARRSGARLLSHLREIAGRHPILGHVRGLGLFIGVELVRDPQSREPAMQEVREIVERMKERGILLSIDGPLHNVIKIKPPIVFSETNADFVAQNLEEVLSEFGSVPNWTS